MLVGSSGLEPPTSRLSGARSNHLSYEPARCKRQETRDKKLHKRQELLCFALAIGFKIQVTSLQKPFLLLASCFLLLGWWR